NLYWYNTAANNYVLQQDVTGSPPIIDEVNRTITINVSHFSTFVLFEAGVNVITGDAFSGTDIEVYNFPNPFDLEPKIVTTIHPNSNQTVRGTMIRFSLKSGLSGDGTLRIHSVTGELVRKIDLGNLAGGRHYYQSWDGRNDSGRDVGSGVYIGVLRVGKKVNTFRMAVVK
ncbi:MAG: FlgD immunoglobulin-like domain containing protein, partial [Elusimicrobiota bacterium]